MRDTDSTLTHRRLVTTIAGGTLMALGAIALTDCGSASSKPGSTGTGGTGGSISSSSGSPTGGGTASSSSSGAGGGGTGGGGTGGSASLAAGWLYTSGAKILVSDGKGGGNPWMGRGVNLDDIFFCGYNNTLWMSGAEQTLTTLVSGLVSAWKPTFVRISLGMASYPTTTSWLTNATQYQTPMTDVIQAIGANPNVYVLVTLRSDASMIGQDTADGDAEATGLPSDATTTPDKTKYPTGTDATYVALVDTFAHASYVLFGLTNEPGGDKLSNAQISAAMSHAVGVIRAEEDHLGVPHHLVSVQGNGWTSDIGFYATTPLPYDNVVYEVHGYPPAPSSYTYANIPVILGEYGSLTNAATFYADVEAKQIPNLAWDFDSYSDCAPDLLEVNQSDTNLQPSAWGMTVQAYLLAHAP
jgi:Cellulase (glycosyl hydrolase family 5)